MNRLLRALLRLYPASFRAEYGEAILAAQAEQLGAAEGRRARLAVVAAAAADTVWSAGAVHGELLRQDLRQAVRVFRRAPGFTATAVTVVALGVGANTAAFSVADHVLLRPLPFPDSNRLVKVWARVHDYTRTELSPATFRDWRAAAGSFESFGAYSGNEVNLVGAGPPERLQAVAVTAEVLPILGVTPLLGRRFSPADGAPDAGATVVLSHRLWRSRFGSDPGVLGRRLLLDGLPHTVIGVMPPSFRFPEADVALWTPLRFAPEAFEDRNDNYLRALGRLRPGATLEGARAELTTAMNRLAEAYPADYQGYGVTAYLLRDDRTPRAALLLLALCGATLCTLLVACANLGALLLARAADRRRELSLRSALGAGRERLVRQLVTESLVLSLAGGMLGVVAARIFLPLLASLVPASVPGGGAPDLDFRALLVAAALALATGLGFGVWPAIRAGRQREAEGLRDDLRAGGTRQRLRSALVVAQLAASVVLLVSSGLLLRALWRLQSVDPGFEAAGVITLRTALPMPKYATTASRLAFYRQVLSEVEALPGVGSAAYASFLPMAMTGGIWPVAVAGEPARARAERVASLRYVTSAYFETLGIPLLAGRSVLPGDLQDRPAVAVVSESFARRYWPGRDPLGRHFTFALAERTVVGVAGDVRVRGPEQASEPQVYLPAGQVPDSAILYYAPRDLAVRSTGDPAALTASIRAIVARADPEQPVSNVRRLDEIVADQTASRRTQAGMLAALAALTALLAALGIHGLLAYAVTSRHREIGVRLALGARRSDVVRLVAGQGLGLAAAGIVPGIWLAYAGGRAMRSLLASIEPGDPPTFAAAVGLCLLAAVAGSLVPALRAVRIDPMTALRAE